MVKVKTVLGWNFTCLDMRQMITGKLQKPIARFAITDVIGRVQVQSQVDKFTEVSKLFNS